MGGPKDQQLIDLIIPPGEAQQIYSANVLAFRVKNFEQTPEGTLRSVVGPTLYEPPRESPLPSTYVGNPHGIFHAGLLGGLVDTLLKRKGTVLSRHAGWNRSWEDLVTGLTDDTRPRYPDQFVVLQNKIIWTNGIDQAQVITHDGMAVPLGFDNVPGAPGVDGPEMPPLTDKTTRFPNQSGYSWPGEIGSVGDILNGETASILDGSWYYYAQWEDVHGNLSALSARSNPVRMRTMNAVSVPGIDAGALSDLRKQFYVHITGNAPAHAVAFRLHRTPDANRVSTVPRLLTRLGGTTAAPYPDNIADASLGPETTQNVPVPVFRTMCAHQGCLVIANIVGDEGRIRRSEPGFPGTFPETEWVYPDSGGAEVTAVTSHGGMLLAFTENSVYDITTFSAPVALAQGIGCTAPRSIQSLPSGMLIWLSRDGFYGMQGTSIMHLSEPIHRTIRDGVNRSRMRMAVAAYDPTSREYRCALAPAGRSTNQLILTFDGASWRRQVLGIHIADMCVTDDWRQYLLAIGDAPVAYQSADGTVTVAETDAPIFTAEGGVITVQKVIEDAADNLKLAEDTDTKSSTLTGRASTKTSNRGDNQ